MCACVCVWERFLEEDEEERGGEKEDVNEDEDERKRKCRMGNEQRNRTNKAERSTASIQVYWRSTAC